MIRSEWTASMERGTTRFDRLLHDAFQGWNLEHPAPRNLAATEKWSRLEAFETLAYELHPLAIVVTGNTAVAHYLWSDLSATDGDRETTHGRYTDVLVRSGDGWRLLAWVGGVTSDED